MSKIQSGQINLDIHASADGISLSISTPRLNAGMTTICIGINDFDAMIEELAKELKLILEAQDGTN